MAASTLNLDDLQFVLKQIKIAEANSTAHGGGALALTEIYVDANGNPVAAGTPGATLADPHAPFGLRTVDGRCNNIVEGNSGIGVKSASRTSFMIDFSINNRASFVARSNNG